LRVSQVGLAWPRSIRAVLAFLLDEHPNQLTIPEVSQAMNAGTEDFGAFDAVERAIRQLDGAGLIHCNGGFAVPTRVALYFRPPLRWLMGTNLAVARVLGENLRRAHGAMCPDCVRLAQTRRRNRTNPLLILTAPAACRGSPS